MRESYKQKIINHNIIKNTMSQTKISLTKFNTTKAKQIATTQKEKQSKDGIKENATMVVEEIETA